MAVVRDRGFDLTVEFAGSRTPEALICEDGELIKEKRFVKVKSSAEFSKLLRNALKAWELLKSARWGGRGHPHFIYALRVDRQRRGAKKGEIVSSTLEVIELAASEHAIND